MIIENQQDVTTAVLSELQRAPDARFKEIMSAFVRHLHELVREVKLTEEEFHAAIAYVIALGKHSNESHNEAVLMSGSLGVSALVCLLNNGDQRQTETDGQHAGAVLADGFAAYAERRFDRALADAGAGAVRQRLVPRHEGQAGRGAEVDVWQSSPEGFYENQDPVQADMNLRGKFTTDADGHFSFRSIKPAGYPIPIDGPVGDLMRAQGRHNMRPAHLHFLIYKPGFKTQISQVYVPDDPNIETDVQFGVTRRLIGDYMRHDERAAAGAGRDGRRGIRSTTSSSWKRAEPSCRGRRSPARPAASGPKIPHLA